MLQSLIIDELERFRLNFSRYTTCDVAPLSSWSLNVMLKYSLLFFKKKYIYTPIIQLRIKTVAGHHNSHDVYYSETVYKLNVTQTVLSLWKTAREDLSFLDGFYCSFNVIITLWTAWNCFYPLIWTNISLASVFLRFLML